MNRIRIGIQRKGRLFLESVKYLTNLGLAFSYSPEALISECINAPVDIVFLRDDDIANCIEKGVLELGIVGENVMREQGQDVSIINRLDFGRCRLCIAVPEDSDIFSIADLEGERIATTYPNLLSEYLQDCGVTAVVFKIEGSVEVMPHVNLSDAICDLVCSGNTLRQNNLRIISEVMRSQAVLLAKNSFAQQYSMDFIQSLITQTS